MEWTKTREGWYIHVIENHDVYFLFSELVFDKHWMHILYNPLILVFFGEQRPRYMTFNVDDPFQNEVILSKLRLSHHIFKPLEMIFF